MGQVDNSQLEAHPTPLQVGSSLPVMAGVAMAAATALIWLAFAPSQDPAASAAVPQSFRDLGPGFVTPVDPGNRDAVTAAISSLRLPEAQQREIEGEVLARRRRIGWIVLIDSMDPDGDMVAVESSGITQQIVLNKVWLPVAVTADSGPIGVTAIRDGNGGGVTVALATGNGSVTLRTLLPGEHLTVVSP